MENKELQQLLEKHLMLFSPEKYLPRYIQTASDIFENRALLRKLPCNRYTLNHLLGIIVETVEGGRRFRTLDCLKVIRDVVRSKPVELELDSDTLARLFYLYKRFVFHSNEDVQWCVSIFIKSQLLDDDSIHWLISNYRKSNHVVNRLLRYPAGRPLIVKWAADVYKRGELRHRKSEVIGLLITDHIPSFVREDNNTSIIWAIYYARTSDEIKQQLLMKYFSFESLDAILEVCIRLHYPRVIEFALGKTQRQHDSA